MRNLASPVTVRVRVLTLMTGLALALFTSSPLLARADADGTPAVPGRLSVATDPAGAAVYVDGRMAGRTPLILNDLPVGEHRVRILHPGYIENGRVVAITSGKVTAVSAKLTPGSTRGETVATPAAAAESSTTAVAPGDPSSKKKWIVIGAVAGGAAAAAFALKGSNAAPIIEAAAATPGTAIQSRNISFTAQGASDPDGDALTYTWDFGDGGSGTGATATHGYSTAGTFTAKVEVSDGKKAASASTTVTVKSATGRWTGAINLGQGLSCNTTINFTQTGSSLSGTYSDCVPNSSGTVSGSVDGAGAVSFTVSLPGIIPFTFTGTPSADVNSLTGVANGSGFVNNGWSMARN